MELLGFRVKKRIFLIPLTLALFGAFVYVVFLKDQSVENQLSRIIPKKAEFSIKGFKLFESLTNGRDWNLDATVAEVYKENDTANLKEVRVVFYNNDGRIFKLFSDTAQLNLTTKVVHLNDNVKIISDDDYTLTTPNAVFYPDTLIVESKENVELVGTDIRITGTGFRGDINKQWIKIMDNVRTEIIEKNPDNLLTVKNRSAKRGVKLNITSKTCEFDLEKNRAIYLKHVIGKGDGFVINAHRMVIDYLVTETSRSVSKILATGSVKINKDGRRSSSERAILITKRSELILTGKPQINDEGNIIKGHKIVYNYTTDKFKVFSATGHYKN